MFEKVEELKDFDIFAGLTNSELESLAKAITLKRYKKRDIIFLPGDQREGIFLLHRGKVKVSRLSEDGREITMEIYKDGDVFGEHALIEGGERQNMASALEPSYISQISNSQMQALMNQIPTLSFNIAKLMGLRRMSIEKKLEDLVFRNVPSRLAKLLLNLAHKYGVELGRNILINAKLSQQELGNLIGSTRETTSHFLNQFRKVGFIDFNKRVINILDKEKLKQLGDQLISLN